MKTRFAEVRFSLELINTTFQGSDAQLCLPKSACPSRHDEDWFLSRHRKIVEDFLPARKRAFPIDAME